MAKSIVSTIKDDGKLLCPKCKPGDDLRWLWIDRIWTLICDCGHVVISDASKSEYKDDFTVIDSVIYGAIFDHYRNYK